MNPPSSARYLRMEEILPLLNARWTQAEPMTSLIHAFHQMLSIYKEGLGITCLAKRDTRKGLLEKEYRVRRVLLNYWAYIWKICQPN